MTLGCTERNKENKSVEVVAACHSQLWADQLCTTAPRLLASQFNDQVQREVTESEGGSGNAIISSWLRKLCVLSLKQEGLAVACSLSSNIRRAVVGKG